MRDLSLTKEQRDRELMLRIMDNTMRTDYALCRDHGRCSSINTHARSVYTSLDKSLWDHNFILAARKYLAEYRDGNLRLLVPEHCKAELHGRGFTLRRFEDRLYVVDCAGEGRLRPGDCVTHLGSCSAMEYRYLARFWLHGDRAERELWDLALDSVDSIGLEGGERLSLKRYPPQTPPAQRLEMLSGNIAYCRLSRLEETAVPPEARGLILDLRSCSGEEEYACLHLLPLLLERERPLGALLGGPYYTNYSENNCRRRLLALRKFLEAGEGRDMAQALIEDTEAKRGRGFLREHSADAYGDEILRPQGDFPVAILTDVFTRGSAELLVRAAKGLPRCILVGRATSGDTDTAELCPMDLGDGFTFLYPMSVSEELYLDDKRRAGEGISPDIHVPWTPEMLHRDLDLAAALEVLGRA